MSRNGYFENLQREILALSQEKEWDRACLEWMLERMSLSQAGECICKHSVRYDFWIRNVENNNLTHVGSSCIRQFMKGNSALVEDVEQAERDWGKQVCRWCNRRTKDDSGYHMVCRRKMEANRRAAAQPRENIVVEDYVWQ